MLTCRMCGGQELYQFLDLGCMPPADQFRCQDRLAQPAPVYPLQVLMCEGCGLAQLGCVPRARVAPRPHREVVEPPGEPGAR